LEQELNLEKEKLINEQQRLEMKQSLTHIKMQVEQMNFNSGSIIKRGYRNKDLIFKGI
jgi:hypothetical protein